MSESRRTSSDSRSNHSIHRVISSERWRLIANIIFDLAESPFSCDIDANFEDTFYQNPQHSRLEATRLFNIAHDEEKKERDSCAHNNWSYFRVISVLWLYVAKLKMDLNWAHFTLANNKEIRARSLLYTKSLQHVLHHRRAFWKFVCSVLNLSPPVKFLPTMWIPHSAFKCWEPTFQI